MTDKDLCYMTAVDAISNFKSRKLSPVELMQAVIARAEEVNPTINAFAHTSFERALEQAKAAEERYAKGSARALEGIAICVKDETQVKGERATHGSLIDKDNVDTVTAPIIERVLRAGAIIHGRSTAPEFSCAAVTHSKLWGVTRNPWNTDFTPGGSSGGGPGRSLRPAPPRSQMARILAVRYEFRLVAVVWSGSSHRMAGYPRPFLSIWTCTVTKDPWPEPSPIALCFRT